ncbi:hypothetical protein [Ilumatobacter coccineus]|jgi:hypothetical protein|uniref:Uncharacterized protein n=1 Tax=Ilumatobacter coccineus (strain NBRC 103263 / KCTC 29153 / YM16-304) TaxID=1313172 RepID=A0A6C7E9E9_ILUCY|nr:hypothetical protein [Ilumatobacter coccineus]BAN01839.1 hypothetical protein YM304_15250 [Ilumatobacter coccineus YM16-304]
MKNSAADIRHIDSAPTAVNAAAEQLTLLSVPVDTRAHQLPTTGAPTRSVHARFRLNKATRERGLQHVAEIRRQLDEAKAAREASNVRRLPSRNPATAA